MGVELQRPEDADRKRLEAAGNGGAWLTSILEYIVYLRDRQLYQGGEAKIESAEPTSVDLTAEQPVVVLKTCVDGSGGQMRYRKTDKPVPVATTAGGTRHTINARLVYAPSAAGPKMWFLVEEKTVGSC
ncbi:hypothetical protein ACFVWG_23395 [Kribbella sp. NPDC058245]|uniref:hypothetical protein n=1 Tax=Kribbella sp. NPDC058245 TaxID=3346399 RepID=UPI0036E5A689